MNGNVGRQKEALVRKSLLELIVPLLESHHLEPPRTPVVSNVDKSPAYRASGQWKGKDLPKAGMVDD